MKKLLTVLIAGCLGTAAYAQHSLEKGWTTDSTSFKNPESVLYDGKAKLLFVTSIGEFGKDNVGYVSKLGLDGKVIKKDWVTGLTSPKGLGMYKNNLYAAENADVAIIDIAKGTVTKKVTIEGAQMLNDITVDSKGVVYASDSKTGKIHKIENEMPTTYMENITGVNGLLSVGTDLYILADGKFWKADKDKKMTQLVDGLEGGMDGIAMVGKDEFLLTGWGGTIYYAKADGTKQLLQDTRDKKINAADLGWDQASKTLYIPQMISGIVASYKLK